MPAAEKESRFFLLIIGLILGLFAIDLMLPLGVAAGAPYVAVVLASAWSRRPRLPLYVAAACSVLTILGAFLSPRGQVLWMVIVNRGLSLFGIWATGILAWYRRHCEEQRLENHHQLETAYEELDSFVRTLSHDLRGSLTPIIGYANFLQIEHGESFGDSGRTALEEIEKQSNRVLALMEDLLTLSRVGHLPRPEQPVSADEIVRAVLCRLAVPEGVQVRIGPLPSLRISQTLVEQVFSNLIGNALRYAGRKGSLIEVGGERHGGKVAFFVLDHGPGVPPAERKQIFEVFYRGSNSRDLPGTGVGLATVQRIARLHGGRAWVEETPGGGATFRVEMREV